MCPNGKFPQFEDSNKMPKRRKFQAGGQRRHPAVVDHPSEESGKCFSMGIMEHGFVLPQPE
jgi:hypothetical protein